MKQCGYQPPVSIRFVTFACEEFGLWGAKHYSQEAFDNDQNIRLMINLDMIANNTASTSGWQIKVMPYDGALDYAAFALQLTELYTSLESGYGSYNSGGTDSYPFWQKGYNVLFFNEAEFSPVYHSSNDLVANLDPEYCAEVIRASLACTVFFADIPGSLESPVAAEATQITSNSFTANWSAVPNASTYGLDVYTKEPVGYANDLFFSEYIEGHGYRNKAIEIYNGTGSEIDLSDYRIEIYTANATSPEYIIPLSGSLLHGDVYVVAHRLANSTILAQADLTTASLWFDGDDQLALMRNSTGSYVDIFGRIGEDPGEFWGVYPMITADKTLVRKNSVNGGITANPVSGFPTLASEWESYISETTAYLGYHTTYETSFLTDYNNLNVGYNTSSQVAGLDPEISYYYKVRAVNDYFTSPVSNEIMVITHNDVTLPVELGSFTAIVSSDNIVTLAWITQTETGMLGYYVRRSMIDQLANAMIISHLIPANNTSQQQSYEFLDSDLFDNGVYFYWLQSVDLLGNTDSYGPISVHFSYIDFDPAPENPVTTELKAIYPNPFNPVAFITYIIAEESKVNIAVFNSRGQRIRDFDQGIKPPGSYRLSWDGTDTKGIPLSSGVYYIIMNAGNSRFQRKALLLK
jgi:hypothetical protein